MKECCEHYRSNDSNKIHKGIRKGTTEMTFESFANGIISLHGHKNASRKSEGTVQVRLPLV